MARERAVISSAVWWARWRMSRVSSLTSSSACRTAASGEEDISSSVISRAHPLDVAIDAVAVIAAQRHRELDLSRVLEDPVAVGRGQHAAAAEPAARAFVLLGRTRADQLRRLALDLRRDPASSCPRPVSPHRPNAPWPKLPSLACRSRPARGVSHEPPQLQASSSVKRGRGLPRTVHLGASLVGVMLALLPIVWPLAELFVADQGRGRDRRALHDPVARRELAARHVGAALAGPRRVAPSVGRGRRPAGRPVARCSTAPWS